MALPFGSDTTCCAEICEECLNNAAPRSFSSLNIIDYQVIDTAASRLLGASAYVCVHCLQTLVDTPGLFPTCTDHEGEYTFKAQVKPEFKIVCTQCISDAKLEIG